MLYKYTVKIHLCWNLKAIWKYWKTLSSNSWLVCMGWSDHVFIFKKCFGSSFWNMWMVHRLLTILNLTINHIQTNEDDDYKPNDIHLTQTHNFNIDKITTSTKKQPRKKHEQRTISDNMILMNVTDQRVPMFVLYRQREQILWIWNEWSIVNGTVLWYAISSKS